MYLAINKTYQTMQSCTKMLFKIISKLNCQLSHINNSFSVFMYATIND